jgi:hypothetical protein
MRANKHVAMSVHLTSAVRRWKKEVGNAKQKVLVFSPYLTSDTADLVLRRAPAELCEIYTTFCAETFASGGSSIQTLRALTADGFIFYELEGLHAKIILISERSVSIGSQNLTRGGTVNKEATVFLTETTEVTRTEKALAPWVASRKPITPEMIADMESRLPKLKRAFRKFREESLATNAAVKLGERARLRQRIRKLQKHLAKIPTAKATVIARVTRIDQTPRTFHGPWNSNVSLLARPGDDLTRWRVEGIRVILDRLVRYMCILENTGKIGWARVGTTRITFVADGIDSLKMEIDGLHYDMTLDAIWQENDETLDNVRITLSPPNAPGKLSISGWFGVDRFSISEIAISDRSAMVAKLKRWILANNGSFQSKIIERMTRPFRYEHNRAGVEAGQFFGPVATIVRLKASLVGRHPVLQASSRV